MKWRERIYLGFIYGISSFLAALIGLSLVSVFDKPPPSPLDKMIKENFLFVTVIAVTIAPLLEELIFRFVPIKLTQRFTKNKKILWLVIICSSVLFGLEHASWHNIFAQGIAGLILSAAFLRGGYWLAVLAHFFHNSFLMLIIFFLGP